MKILGLYDCVLTLFCSLKVTLVRHRRGVKNILFCSGDIWETAWFQFFVSNVLSEWVTLSSLRVPQVLAQLTDFAKDPSLRRKSCFPPGADILPLRAVEISPAWPVTRSLSRFLNVSWKSGQSLSPKSSSGHSVLMLVNLVARKLLVRGQRDAFRYRCFCELLVLAWRWMNKSF